MDIVIKNHRKSTVIQDFKIFKKIKKIQKKTNLLREVMLQRCGHSAQGLQDPGAQIVLLALHQLLAVLDEPEIEGN